MSLIKKDDFGVIKIFDDDALNPLFYQFQIGTWGHDDGDRDHFENRKYGDCKDECGDKQGTPKCSVVSTEWEKGGLKFVDQEVTGYFFLPKIESDRGKNKCYKYERGGKGSGLAIKQRGSKHPSGKDPNSAKCYIFDFQYEGETAENH
ncbi:MAG TPA: hypothetical protein VJS91_06685, partial [Nitrososphaeraceae archaeon]|nr:hypothetical protein [Nitrososphaeraceae archaeon]